MADRVEKRTIARARAFVAALQEYEYTTGEHVQLPAKLDKHLAKLRIAVALLPEEPVVEDQSKNGVKVIVRRTSQGSTVEASCSCHGVIGRAHSTTQCPLLRRFAPSLV